MIHVGSKANTCVGLVRRVSACGVGAALAMALLGGSSLIANAQTPAKDPAACTETCKTEKATCLGQFGTQEMCGHEYKTCVKTCEK